MDNFWKVEGGGYYHAKLYVRSTLSSNFKVEWGWGGGGGGELPAPQPFNVHQLAQPK